MEHLSAEAKTGVAVASAVVLGGAAYLLLRKPQRGADPFATDARRPAAPFEADKGQRRTVLKQQFAPRSIPDALDAVVVGSGIGGLTVAALMARAGKRVLVLEQHDKAGGCTHTFTEHGYEFDVGIHYIGEMLHNTALKFLLDQISGGQIVWSQLHENYDTVVLGNPAKGTDRRVPIYTGRDAFKAHLKESFPEDGEAIDRFVDMLDQVRRSVLGLVMVKFMPLWMAKFLVKTRLINWMTDYFKLSRRTLAEVLEELTPNEDLRATLAYCFGDYGTLPKDTSFTMHAVLIAHFLYGVAYPRGGSSEFAYHIIPTIEKAGGKVLVNACVESVVLDQSNRRAIGVRVKGYDHVIPAPLVISDAGIYNTYEKLLSPEARQTHPAIDRVLSRVRHGVGCMTVYIGLKGSAEDLNLPKTNTWAFFNGNKLDADSQAFLDADLQEFLDNPDAPVPLLFISFPSTKDPTWPERFPNRSTCEIVTFARWEWFEQWKDERVSKRADEYKYLKTQFSERVWEQTVALYPQLAEAKDYFDAGSPLSNNHYIASPKGEIYGIDHDVGRFSAETALELRPQTPIQGLLLTGQDVFTCGFAGAMFGGLFAASAALNRNLYEDLQRARKRFKKQAAQ